MCSRISDRRPIIIWITISQAKETQTHTPEAGGAFPLQAYFRSTARMISTRNHRRSIGITIGLMGLPMERPQAGCKFFISAH